MSDFSFPPRPATPQVLVHRLPDAPEATDYSRKPEKYVVLITGSAAVAGKLQIARDVSTALSCPSYHGESMHESSAKAASVGFSRQVDSQSDQQSQPGHNEARYQRMWLSKMTRTGLLFPEESRAATEGFSGFGGTSSASTSRRGSASSVASASSSAAPGSSIASSRRESVSLVSGPPTSLSAENSMASHRTITISETQRLRQANPVLMVLTHPGLEQWHRNAIKGAVRDYSIGVIFTSLERGEEEDEEDDELPILRPLDPTTMTSFPVSFGSFASKARRVPSLDEELKLNIDVDNDIQGKTAEIIQGVRDMVGLDG
ncbi:hypothetical protein BJ166DRAFT_543704 [Pestalotiopsis sp. NC0098]|nr:hypothetical protein BJ166DRAFT_543704 [Pestalotiopsis sp. NC0098]